MAFGHRLTTSAEIEIFAIKNGVMAGRGTNGQAATATNTEFLADSLTTDLGVLGGTFSALGIDGLGHAAETETSTTGVIHGFFWQSGQGIVDLGVGATNAINDSNQVVGAVSSSATAMARVLLSGTSPTGSFRADATAELGESAAAHDRCHRSGHRLDGRCRHGGLEHAGKFPGLVLSVANGINDKGEIVGSAFNQAQLNQAYVFK